MRLDAVGQAVIFGAGALGRKALSGLRRLGVSPVAFCDNDQALWNKSVDGLRVLPPAVAALSFAETHLFLICIWHPSKVGMRCHIRQLETLGCRQIVSFAEVFLSYPETYLPHGFFEDPKKLEQDQGQIAAARELFDGADKAEFASQVDLRLTGNFGGLSDPVSGAQYFPSDLVRLQERECFVDCGAFNGDTLEEFLDACGGQFHEFVALEPDPANFAALELKLLDSRITAYQMAASSARAKLPFRASGTVGSAVAPDGTSLVDCAPLDELLDGRSPSYIKMDVEGHELEALAGARERIRDCKPRLAVCVYHKADHLWKIPLLMKELQPDASLHLRPHLADGWELVCYSIPR